jgi:hypothetical protein
VINGIRWTVHCEEKCVSGSGSNRETHRHDVVKQTEQLVGARELRAGESLAFDFGYTVPEQSPPSLKLSDNELNWSCELRIDIPKWPDWVRVFQLTVVPSAKTDLRISRPSDSHFDDEDVDDDHDEDESEEVVPSAGKKSAAPRPAAVGGAPATDEAWFDEVVQQVALSRHDPDRLQTVLDAVREHVFQVRLDILRELRQPPALQGRETGTWALAEYRPRNMQLCLYWPDANQIPTAGTINWRGAATLIGFDERLGCPLMHVVV